MSRPRSRPPLPPLPRRLPLPPAGGALLPAVIVLAVVLAVAALPPHARADAFGAELALLTTHVQSQRDALVESYERRLDGNGRHVLTPGVELYYDRTLAEPVWGAGHLRFAGGLVEDSVRHKLGYLAVMGSWLLWEAGAWRWTLQAGPGLLFRESWRGVPGYAPDNLLRETDSFLKGYEWALLPLGDLDLSYRFSEGLRGVWSIFPGVPYVIVQSLGLRWSF